MDLSASLLDMYWCHSEGNNSEYNSYYSGGGVPKKPELLGQEQMIQTTELNVHKGKSGEWEGSECLHGTRHYCPKRAGTCWKSPVPILSMIAGYSLLILLQCMVIRYFPRQKRKQILLCPFNVCSQFKVR